MKRPNKISLITDISTFLAFIRRPWLRFSELAESIHKKITHKRVLLISICLVISGITNKTFPEPPPPDTTLTLSGTVEAGEYIARDWIVMNDGTYPTGFEARLDESLIFDIEYLGSQPPADRELDYNLEVGTTKGSFNVIPNGAATYAIPIIIPPGTAGVEPNIAITYNSHAGIGMLGRGWNISGISAITRLSTNFYNDGFVDGVDFDSDDQFVLDGQRLIYYPHPGFTEYRTEHETFSRIISHDSANVCPQHFTVETKSGLTMEYGNTMDSRIEAQGRSDVLIWYVNKITDQYDNYISFKYYEDSETGEARIEKIEYTGNDGESLEPYNTIEFFYERKDDSLTSYVYGSKVKNNMVLRKLNVTSESSLVREYYFEYIYDDETRLVKIIEKAPDGTTYNSTVSRWGIRNATLNTYDNSIASTFATAPGDFSGDGQTDILAYSSSWVYLVANPNFGVNPSGDPFNMQTGGTFDGDKDFLGMYECDFDGNGEKDVILRYWDDENNYYTYTFYTQIGGGRTDDELIYYYDHFFLTGDFDGDGIDDLLIAEENGYWEMYSYKLNPDGTMSPLALRDNGDVPTWGYSAHSKIKHIPLDFNGNGKIDILVLDGADFLVYEYNNNDLTQIYTDDDNLDQYVLVSGDFNGDGNSDLYLRINSVGLGKFKISTGDGFIDIDINTFDDFLVEDGHNNYNNYYAPDINGDGKSDIVVIGKGNSITNPTKIYVAYSLGESLSSINTYTPSESLVISPNYNQFGDFNGDGNYDYLYINNVDHISKIYTLYQGRDNMLVESIINGLNLSTTIDYKPMTDDNNDFYSKGSAVTFPLINIQLPLYMVSSIGLDNGVGGTTTLNYKYSRAILHRQGRGFLGLGSSTVTNTAINISTITTQALNTDYYYFSPSSILKEITGSTDIASITYTNDVEHYGDKRIFPHVKLMHVNDYLKGTDISTTYTYSSSDINYGNLTSELTKYVPNEYKKTTKNYEYVQAGAWCPSKVSKLTVHKDRYPESRYTRVVDFTYNDEGQVFTKETDGQKPVKTKFEYDNPFGLLTNVTDSAAEVDERYIDYEYDTKYRFVTKTTNSLGHYTKATYDGKTGNMLTSKDVNGLRTSYRYDGFGRHIETILPDGNMIFSSLYWDNDNGPSEAVYYSLDEANGANPIKTYYDILGRTLRTENIGFDGSIIYVDKEYNSKGQLLREREPTFNPPASEFTTYLHDDYGRVWYINSPTANYSIDYDGLTVTTTNVSAEPDQVTSKTVDELGLLISSTDADDNTVTYAYYSSGLPKQITAPGGAITKMQYDLYGNRTQLIEPNAGTYNCTYNAFSELTMQVENGDTTIITYDNLGRPDTITELEGITTYTYDTKPNGKGLIASITSPGGVSEDYTYDEYSRLVEKTETIDGINFIESMNYDNYGRLSRLIYPSGFGVTYHYNNYHYLSEIKHADNQVMIWKAEEMNERLQIEQFRSGNNLITSQSFGLGFITGIQTGSIQDMQYDWDIATGNLNWRKDANRNLIEYFKYDNVNRLIKDSIVGGATVNFGYYANGNIDSTTFAGIYSYESSRPHAVTSVTNPNSLISPADQVIDYTSFNKAKNITEDLYELQIYYGVDKKRRKIDKRYDEYIELRRYYAHFNYEKDIEGSTVTERHYIFGGTGLAAILEKEGDNETMYYIHKDHLGSINCITDQNGALVQEMSFDAWGRRRNPNNWTYTGLPSSFIFDRGFTSHEHLDEFVLINMNGRVYDPLLGRFLSPDNFVQAPDFTQSYNRYSYCFNNPLVYIDSTGNFLGTIITFIGDLIKTAFFDGGLDFTSKKARQRAWKDFDPTASWSPTNRAWKIDIGLFKTDPNKNFFGRAWQLVSRFIWELPQTLLGNIGSHGTNLVGSLNEVNYFNGATVLDTDAKSGAMTIGNYIFGPENFKPDFRDHLFVHEYGHYIQSQIWGPFYIPLIGIPSFESAFFSSSERHRSRWFEAQASRLAANYFDKYFGTGAPGYIAGLSNFFDKNSFINQGILSPYQNPRNLAYNYSGHPQRGRLHWSDPFLYLYLTGLIFLF